MDVLIMLWKMFLIQLLAFVIASLSCKLMISIVERNFLKGNYKIKTSFSYLLAAIIMLVASVILGKEVLYALI